MEDKNNPRNPRFLGDKNVFFKRLRVLIFFRVFFVTLLLGSFSLFSIGHYKITFPQGVIYLIIFIYILSIVYFFLLKRVSNLYLFAYTQLIIDAIGEIVLIYLTGGIESWFTSIMLLTVMASPIVLNKRAGYTIATILSILYGSMLDLQYYGVINLSYEVSLREKDFLYNIFTHITALYLTAYLAGYLVSRLEKTTKKLEEKDVDLQDLTIFNRELIESLPSGLITTDREGIIMIFNKAAEAITGLSRSKVIGKDIKELFPFLTPPFKVQREETTLNFNGDKKIVGLTISETANSDGEKTGYICIFRDITNLKKLEAELNYKRTLATIGELSANMAHEIRNPLASLKGAIEMLREGKISKEQSEKLMNIALNEMDRLNKIITDFLMYSRPSPPEFTSFDLHELLGETLDMAMISSSNQADISLRKGFSGDLFITGDPNKLRQVFINLTTNAIESMGKGGELKVSTMVHDGYVDIRFEDSGVGIKPENLEKIFYPFYTTKDWGTGLGLSIVYRIIQEHKGSIRVDSVPGKGTIFELELPLNQNFC
ncbi:MAG: two-component system sensor histidine kinase NtrB [Thermodesulfovibrionales bacterium]